jgi:hypothetical protein
MASIPKMAAPLALMTANSYCARKQFTKLDSAIFLRITAPMGQGKRMSFADWDAIKTGMLTKK